MHQVILLLSTFWQANFRASIYLRPKNEHWKYWAGDQSVKYIRTRCAGIVQEKTYGKRKFRSIEGRKFLEQTTKLAHDFLRNKKIWSPCTWLFWHTEYSIWQRHTKRGCISLIRFIVSGCDRIGSQHFIRQYVLFGTFGIRNDFILYSTNI